MYVHLKGTDLYAHKETGRYQRNDFMRTRSTIPADFRDYIPHTDILMNGIYWEKTIPVCSRWKTCGPDFRIKTIADITDDQNGSIPCNLGDATIEKPVYGVDRNTLK